MTSASPVLAPVLAVAGLFNNSMAAPPCIPLASAATVKSPVPRFPPHLATPIRLLYDNPSFSPSAQHFEQEITISGSYR